MPSSGAEQVAATRQLHNRLRYSSLGPPAPDPKAQSWAEKNDWFGADEVMTYAAFGIHRKLVEEEGFDPETEEYYTEVDRRMRSEFPHKFQTKKSVEHRSHLLALQHPQ